MLLGWFLSFFYSTLDLLQKLALIIFKPTAQHMSNRIPLSSWAAGEVENLFFIFLIILALIRIMRVPEKVRAIDLMSRALCPGG